MRQSTSLTLKQLPMPSARKQIAQYTKQELLRYEIADGAKMAAMVKQEYKSGKLRQQRKLADRLPHHTTPRTKNNETIEINKILVISCLIKNGISMTNAQIKREINLTRPKGDQLSQYAISGAAVSLERQKRIHKTGWVKTEGRRKDLVAAYAAVKE